MALATASRPRLERYRHFELYYAIAGIGAVCHTINPRLFPEQIAWIVNHAEDRALFFDLTFAPLVDGLVEHFRPGCSGSSCPTRRTGRRPAQRTCWPMKA
ncbi:MAG: hypothetical protein HPM95_08935 [Alphaproteobacteria bacterium]|nr:hypothetical protein [Alphaproteobacteria bacterium]